MCVCVCVRVVRTLNATFFPMFLGLTHIDVSVCMDSSSSDLSSGLCCRSDRLEMRLRAEVGYESGHLRCCLVHGRFCNWSGLKGERWILFVCEREKEIVAVFPSNYSNANN